MTSRSRRDFMKGMAAGALALAWPQIMRAAGPAGRKPNIVFIIADDMGYANLGCFGSKAVLTPNIDRMAAEGIKFTDCYSGDTVCAPARSTLMTGLHKGHTPVRGNSGGIPLLPEDVTVADVLKKAGYATGAFGKWGLGNQGKDGAAERHGFDVFYGYYNQWHAHSYNTNLFRNSQIVNEDRSYTHYAIFEEALKFIRDNADKPFFCYCPWTPPHGSYVIPKDDQAVELYKDKDWPKDAKAIAAMDSMVDRHVGEILALLKKLGIDEDTIVFFTSDNGADQRLDGVLDSCGKFKGFKRSMNEGGIRVPMVVRWPGKIKAGQVSGLPWYFPDVMPTLAELAGATKDVPKNIDGISIVPTLLATGPQTEHEYLYWALGDKQPGTQAVRTGKFKGIGGPNGVKLYDLSTDIGEEHDLAAEHPDIAKKISDIMAKAWVAPRSQADDGKYIGETTKTK
jgi:arylsulfatase A-like enzyme